MTKTEPELEEQQDNSDDDQQVAELTMDLQRTRADFENYRKRVEQEKLKARNDGQATAVLKLLPVIDNIERAIAHTPAELVDNAWAQSVARLVKHLDKSLESLHLVRVDATPGTIFNPELHEAIQFDEDADGSQEIIAEELQAGYVLSGKPIRPAMVKVTKR